VLVGEDFDDLTAGEERSAMVFPWAEDLIVLSILARPSCNPIQRLLFSLGFLWAEDCLRWYISCAPGPIAMHTRAVLVVHEASALDLLIHVRTWKKFAVDYERTYIVIVVATQAQTGETSPHAESSASTYKRRLVP
jgi:hypothetical protein